MHATCSIILLLSLVLPSSFAVIAAEVQLPLIASGAHDTIRASMPVSARTSDKQADTITKLPADLAAARFGQFEFGPKESPLTIAFAFDDPTGKPARLFIDANGNGDLTDDPAPEWSMSDKERDGKTYRYGQGSVMLYLKPGDASSKVRVKLYRYLGSEPSMRGDLQYYPDYARIGKVNLDGKNYGVILHDEHASGDYRHFATSVKIDLNGDGRFDFRTESFQAKDPFKIGDTVYEVTGVTADGSSFQIAKSTRPLPEKRAPAAPVAAVQAGQQARAFEATTINGQKVSFPGGYKGKIVLLDFWATWCGPCIGELPNLIKAYEAHHANGLEVLGISLDSAQTKDKLPEFLKAKNMTWPQVCDGKGWDADISRLYGVRAIPSAFLIDGTTGVVLATQRLRGEQLSRTIEDALSGKLKPDTATASPSPDLARGLLAIWNANGDAVEMKSQMKGEPRKVTFADGVQGQAFDFTSADAAVVMSESTLKENFAALTLAAWVKARSHGHADYDGFGRTIISRTEDGGFALRVLDGRIQLDLRTEDGGVHKLLFQHEPLPLNTWVHLCATYDGAIARAYVNGAPASNTFPVSGKIKVTARPSARLMIGNEPGTVPNDPAGIIQPGHFGWDGLVDQLAVYDRALNNTEVTTIYTRSNPMRNPFKEGEARQEVLRNHMFEIARLAETDRDAALKIVFDGLSADPLKNPWATELVMIYQADERRGRALKRDERPAHFTEARAYLLRGRTLAEEALKKHSDDTSLKYGLGELDEALARANLELGETAKAKELASKQLAANTDSTDWNYGNVIHQANCTLGRAALRDGDKKLAADFLRKAGATPGSPQLNSFGPDWTFAREMIEAGETQAVLDYFDLVEKFWVSRKNPKSSAAKLADMHEAKLKQWRDEVRAGKVPDFKP